MSKILKQVEKDLSFEKQEQGGIIDEINRLVAAMKKQEDAFNIIKKMETQKNVDKKQILDEIKQLNDDIITFYRYENRDYRLFRRTDRKEHKLEKDFTKFEYPQEFVPIVQKIHSYIQRIEQLLPQDVRMAKKTRKEANKLESDIKRNKQKEAAEELKEIDMELQSEMKLTKELLRIFGELRQELDKEIYLTQDVLNRLKKVA